MNPAAASPATMNVARWICPLVSRLRNASTNHNGTKTIAPSGTASTAAISAAFTLARVLEAI